ncbi:MFS transporter [Chitinophaga parva]|uniref:MFS transporter n=1 Tax=Chitinophaga parva TaxID=2169414 RepID=A0A2T7BBB7_9BACT|nr:MFS transporter [Chitinophaga parva]PUZ21689.1 MFS transporter [Chitinophaga parva]
MNTPSATSFTRYQKFMIALIALIQFTVILDFMVISPLGAMLTKSMRISATQFGWIVSAYAFSAAVSGIAAAGFADRFDRKQMLLFFYAGFTGGTLLCGVASGFWFLLMARMVTGLFGGVMFSIGMAIVADLFPLQVRGRVMGFVQMAFASSQVLGIPIGLKLAGMFDWHAPFLLIVGVCVLIGLAIWRGMQPMREHLKRGPVAHPMQHLLATAAQPRYQQAFLTTVFISTGGFLLMPYSSNFLVNNVGIKQEDLFMLYMVTGAAGLVAGPLIGRLADKAGKYNVFIAGSCLAILMVIWFTQLGITPLWLVMIVNAVMMTAVTSRMIPSQALISAVPDMKDRGAFMAINASVQQMGGGVAAVIGGAIITSEPSGFLHHFDVIGYVCVAAFVICAVCMFVVNKAIQQKQSQPAAEPTAAPVIVMAE